MITLDLAFIIQIINFGILVLVLNLALYKPVRAMLAHRRLEVESARERKLAVDKQVDDKILEYEKRLQDARTEAGTRRAELVKSAQAEEAGLLEKARSEAAASIAALRKQLAIESAEARGMLQKQAESLSGDICEKILGRSL